MSWRVSKEALRTGREADGTESNVTVIPTLTPFKPSQREPTYGHGVPFFSPDYRGGSRGTPLARAARRAAERCG
jgi:hypothetical protein